jgi:hypothetical protein
MISHLAIKGPEDYQALGRLGMVSPQDPFPDLQSLLGQGQSPVKAPEHNIKPGQLGHAGGGEGVFRPQGLLAEF